MRKSGIIIILSAFAMACVGGNEEKSKDALPGKSTVEVPKTLEEAEKNFKEYKGIGPISSLELPAEIDASLAEAGKGVFDTKCAACHKTDVTFVGPAPKGILERRTPEWVMNMILNPDEMVQKDVLAKLLLVKYNLAPMANQNLTEQEARSVLEYFRTL